MLKCCFRYDNDKTGVLPISKNKLIQYNSNNNLFENMDFSEKNYKPVLLGKGLTGAAYKITIDNIEYTCKKINKQFNEEVLDEVLILNEIRNAEMLPCLYKAIINPLNYFILYKHIYGVDLEQYIKKKKPLKEKKVAIITNEILKGLDYLFSYNLVHLDIKLENIIIEDTNPLKITLIDLAFSRKMNSNNKLECISGTIGYCAPEVLLYKRYSHNSDIWSLGIVIYNLLTMYDLFTSKRSIYISELGEYRGLSNFKRAKLKLLNKDVIDLLENMITKIPIDRYSIKDVRNHKFIKDNIG